MGYENGQGEHEGEHYLNLIGLGDFADQDIVMHGVTRKARDFLEDEACAAEARPALVGFERLSHDDPLREASFTILHKRVAAYLNIVPEADS